MQEFSEALEYARNLGLVVGIAQIRMKGLLNLGYPVAQEPLFYKAAFAPASSSAICFVRTNWLWYRL